MAEDTRIEWADDTVNPWWGCTKASPACANCYAETLDARFKMGGETHWGPGAPRFIRVEKAIGELERIARRSDKEGRPRRVFIASMADVFEDRPDLVEPRKKLWDALRRLAGDEPRITPLLLTKRPDVMAAWAEEYGWPAGCWAGTTVEDQRRADERIPHLLRVPATVRFLSMEPLLGPVDLGLFAAEDSGEVEYDRDGYPAGPIACPRRDLLRWVIAGGESGPQARPSHPEWFRSIREQCEAAGVAFHFKQWGAWAPWDGDNWEIPGGWDDVLMRDAARRISGVDFVRVGKKRAGRLLDGRTHDEVPHG